jgi:hypothetical protein
MYQAPQFRSKACATSKALQVRCPNHQNRDLRSMVIAVATRVHIALSVTIDRDCEAALLFSLLGLTLSLALVASSPVEFALLGAD